MGVFTWKGGSGNLASAANWLNEDNPADPVVPGVNDGVLIDATGTLTGSLDIQSETISGNLTLAGQMTATGGAGISSGTFTLAEAAAKLIVGDLAIGSNGAGALTVSNDASVAIASFLELGTENGSTGAVSINAAGKLTTKTIFVGGQPGSPGSISISGAGSALSANGPVSIGGEGKGSLSIGLGGVFSDIDTADELSIASIAGVTGAVSISGKGSTLTDAGRFSVGRAGSGSLSITDGGWLSITSAYGTNYQQGIDVAAEADASGAITVAGAGSTITDVGFFAIGYVGTGSLAVTGGAAVIATNPSGIEVAEQSTARGALTVSGGSKVVTTTGGVTVGNSAGAVGSVSVSGAGSLIYSNGYLGFGGPGKGSLTIAAGGKVNDVNSSVGVSAGAQAGGNGTILVTGAGSKLVVASYLEIGYAGTGNMSIAAGGVVSVYGPNNSAATVLAGGTAGGVGAITVDGAGSSLTADSPFGIGYGGKGSLSVTNGASVDEYGGGASAFAVGVVAGSNGAVSVSGVGSKLESSTGFQIGASGMGSMSVTAGATVTATDYLVFGFGAGSHGVGTIAGATVTVGQAGFSADDVLIGGNGVGVLTVGAGGVLTDADSAGVGVGSTLAMAGGSFRSTFLNNHGAITGFGAIKSAIFNAGLIEATGGGGLTIAGTVRNTARLVAAGGTLTVNGAVSGAGTVTIDGGKADFAGAFNENVTFTGTTGSLELAHAQTYAGKIRGFSLTGGTSLDLVDIAFTSGVTKAVYSGTVSTGVLTVTSGAEVARIKFVGDYRSSTWTLGSDNHGGTAIVDPTPAAATPRPTSSILPFVTAMASFDPGGGDWAGAAETAPSRPQLLAAVRSGR